MVKRSDSPSRRGSKQAPLPVVREAVRRDPEPLARLLVGRLVAHAALQKPAAVPLDLPPARHAVLAVEAREHDAQLWIVPVLAEP